MKASEIRSLSTDELQSRVMEEEKALYEMKFKAALGQVENPLRMRTLRRGIARMKTILNQQTNG